MGILMEHTEVIIERIENLREMVDGVHGRLDKLNGRVGGLEKAKWMVMGMLIVLGSGVFWAILGVTK